MNPNNYIESTNFNPMAKIITKNPYPQPLSYNNEEKFILDNIKMFVKDANKCRIVQNKFDEKKDFYKFFYEKVILHNQFIR